MIEVVVRTITVNNSPTGNLHTLLGIVVPNSGTMLFRTTEYAEPVNFKVEITKISKDAEILIYLDKLFEQIDIQDDMTLYLCNRATVSLFDGSGYYWLITPEIAKAYANLKTKYNLKVCRYDTSVECCKHFPYGELKGTVRGEFTTIELPSGKSARQRAEKLNQEYEEFKRARDTWNKYAKIRVRNNPSISKVERGYGLWCDCIGPYESFDEDIRETHMNQLDKFHEQSKILCKKCNTMHNIRPSRYTCWRCGQEYFEYTPYEVSGCSKCNTSFVD